MLLLTPYTLSTYAYQKDLNVKYLLFARAATEHVQTKCYDMLSFHFLALSHELYLLGALVCNWCQGQANKGLAHWTPLYASHL